jgi:hypothetical protein
MYVQISENGEVMETISQAIEWEMMESEFPITRVQALDRLMRDACVYGRKFYTSDGHLIPLSSYLPRKGDLSGTQF